MTRASDYSERIDDLINVAQRGYCTPQESSFLSDLDEKYEAYGEDMFLSESQHSWLVSIAARKKHLRS